MESGEVKGVTVHRLDGEDDSASRIVLMERLMRKDLVLAAESLGRDEARFMVDTYYQIQDDRKRSENQNRSLVESEEPNAFLSWLVRQNNSIENEIKKALDIYTASNEHSKWARGIIGIGPVIAAGLLAHLDPVPPDTVGHWWRFGGMDPTVIWSSKDDTLKWLSANKAERSMHPDEPNNLFDLACQHFGRNPKLFRKHFLDDDGQLEKITLQKLATALARRPWNANLKTLLWKCGESFTKVSGNEKSLYGALYKERKKIQEEKNERGEFAEQAALALKMKNYGKETESYKAYVQGKLPKAQIYARAKRHAVKIFLAHYHAKGRILAGLNVPLPYVIAHKGHSHLISWEDAA